MIIVTGHRGFIGTRITSDLDTLGIKWVGYDIADLNNNDIRNLRRLDEVFEKYQIDSVIHLAALAGVRRGEDYPQDYFDTNVIGTENILKMCKKYKVKKFIAFSSSAIHGQDGYPASIYGISKLSMESVIRRYKEDIPFIGIVRPFTVYGENGRRDQVIFKWINCIKENKPIPFYGDGNSYRTYTYVGDLSKAIITLLECEEADDVGVFEIGGKEEIRLEDLLQIFKEGYSDIKVNYLPFPKMDSMGRSPDMKNIKVLGWEPVQDFKSKVLEIIKKELYE